MDWKLFALGRVTQLPARVQISRIFDWPHSVLYCRGGRYGDHVRNKSHVIWGSVPNELEHGNRPTRYSCVSPSLDVLGVRTDGITGKVSVGAFADSAYEYMLKQWLLSGRTDTKARDLCMIPALLS